MDAGRLLRKHGVADRRRFRVLDRISQERTWQTARLAAGARSRPQHDRSRLCGGVLGPCAGAGDAVQYRAQRRHDLSHRQQHSADLRLGARTDRRQNRHLCDVDRVCDHRRDQLAVPHRAGVDIGWSQWFTGFAPLGIPLLLLVPLLAYVICRPQVKEGPEIVTWSSTELAAMGPPSRSEWIMAALVVLAMFLWITDSNPAISLPVLGSNFINPGLVVFVVITLMLVTGIIEFDDIVAEKGAWEVFFYFTSLLTLSSGLNEIGFIKWVAEGYAKPLATVTPTIGMILLVSFFFWVHYFFSSITSHAAAVLPVVLA